MQFMQKITKYRYHLLASTTMHRKLENQRDYVEEISKTLKKTTQSYGFVAKHYLIRMLALRRRPSFYPCTHKPTLPNSLANLPRFRKPPRKQVTKFYLKVRNAQSNSLPNPLQTSLHTNTQRENHIPRRKFYKDLFGLYRG